MHDLVALYLFAVRSGDRALARALAAPLRSQPALCDDADRALRALPRGPRRSSAAAVSVVTRLMRRLAPVPP